MNALRIRLVMANSPRPSKMGDHGSKRAGVEIVSSCNHPPVTLWAAYFEADDLTRSICWSRDSHVLIHLGRRLGRIAYRLVFEG